MKQERRAQKFISPHWWTSVIWKMTNWRLKHQKYKGRVVLRGDIVKDDSGSCAVFTEQGSSASQMTAAKVMDIISRLPGCAGEAADAVSACTQVKMEDAPKLLKIPKSECPDIWIRQPRHKWPESWSSMEDPAVPGDAIWENPIAARLGEGFHLGMLSRTPWKRVILICECGRDKADWKEAKKTDVESTQQRSRFGRTNFILWSCVPGMYSKTMWNKQRYYGQLQNHVWITIFAGGAEKLPFPQKSSYFFMVLWFGGSGAEMCGTMLWVGKQDDSTTLQSINSMHRRQSFQRRRIEICRNSVKSMLSNCSEKRILGKNWTTWFSMVSK